MSDNRAQERRSIKEHPPVLSGEEAQTVTAYYSQQSRLFTSSYAAFFTIYGVFVLLVYNVVIPNRNPENLGVCITLTVGVVALLLFTTLFLTRAWLFGKVLDGIEKKSLVFERHLNGSVVYPNVVDWFEVLSEGRLSKYLVKGRRSETIGWILIGTSFVLSLALIWTHYLDFFLWS
jgi:hypothetical protein